MMTDAGSPGIEPNSIMHSHLVHLIGQLGRGGSERQLLYLASALRQRGWTQTVVAFSLGDVLEESVISAGIPVVGVPRRRLKPWRLWDLRRVLQQERPRVIVSWTSTAAVYADWVWGIGKPRRLFNVRNDLLVDARTGKFNKSFPLFRRALERSDYAVSNSGRNLETLQERGVRLPEHEVIYNIVLARGRATPANPVSRPRIAVAGHLRHVKGYDVLLESLGSLAAEGVSFELQLAGEGPERPRLERLIEEHGLAGQVELLGEVADVSDLLTSSHLLVQPSRSEGLSNAILEAMAAGLPVVATSVGGSTEIIEDERNGLIVPPEDPVRLAGAIRRLVRDPVLRGRIGEAGFRFVHENCSMSRIADRYEQILHRLLTD